MKQLGNTWKQMAIGLAHPDTGGLFRREEQTKVSGFATATMEPPSRASRGRRGSPAAKRITLISDGRGVGVPLEYAIDSPLRQDGRSDLSIHGAIDTRCTSGLEERARQPGLDDRIVGLVATPLDALTEYVFDHPSLASLVAMPDDAAMETRVREVMPKGGSRAPVPLVRIEDRPALRTEKRSAA